MSYDKPRPSETNKNMKYSRASASQKQKFWTGQQKVVNNEWSDEVASELDESSDELMTGYRRNGSRQRIQLQNSGSKRQTGHESKAFSPERQRVIDIHILPQQYCASINCLDADLNRYCDKIFSSDERIFFEYWQ